MDAAEQMIWLLFNTSIDCNLGTSCPDLDGLAGLPDGRVYSIHSCFYLAGFCIIRGRLQMIGRSWIVLFSVIYGCILCIVYDVYILVDLDYQGLLSLPPTCLIDMFTSVYLG